VETVVGVAINCTVGGVPDVLGAVTATAADTVAVPPLPVAVATYVVEFVGLTDFEPDGPCKPTPGSMSTDVALLDDQVRVEDCPPCIFDGEALS
jgi:hypothetical protein